MNAVKGDLFHIDILAGAMLSAHCWFDDDADACTAGQNIVVVPGHSGLANWTQKDARDL